MKKKLITVCFLVPFLLQAQDADIKTVAEDENVPEFLKNVSIGGNFGPTIFYGDVTLYSFLPWPKHWSESIGSAYSIFVKREIKWGLGAQFQFALGTWKGRKASESLTYDSYFRGNYSEYTFQATFDLGDFLFKNSDKFRRRVNVYGYLGIGFINFRSELVWAEDPKNYRSGLIVSTEGFITSPGLHKEVLEKDKMTTELIFPVGLNFGLKMNQKIDLHWDISIRYSYTDKLDSWERQWTSRDRYLYSGFGVTYTFGRSPIQYDRDRSEEKVGSSSGSSSKKGGLFGKRRRSSTEDKELYELRLKLFETQLKLFELQYLMEGGSLDKDGK